MPNKISESAVILLAGGKSSRMGEPKGLVSVDGRPWLESQLEKLAQAGAKEVVLVLGHDSELYRRALPWVEQALKGPIEHGGVTVKIALNRTPELGQFSSLQAGARSLEKRGAWVLPIDCPCPDSKVWSEISAAAGDAVMPTHQGKGGHPVRLSATLLTTLSALSPEDPDSRLDVQLHKIGPRCTRVEVADPAILGNRNRPGDWSPST